MDILLGLASLAALSLFLAHVLQRSASLMPLVAASGSMLFFTLMGCFGLLRVAGWVWYGAALAALVYLVFFSPGGTLRKLLTPGFVMFLALSAAFILLFFFTRPLLTQWDEFTVWGTAAKQVKLSHQLYTTQPGNLLANVAPPGLAVFSYMLQFFSVGFVEYKFIAGFAILHMAAFAAGTALWDKNRVFAVIYMGMLVLLPFLFEGGAPGASSWAYLTCMADYPMAVLFGGALALYISGGAKDHTLLLCTGVVLAELTNLKDMGFAFACVAAVVIIADLLFCRRDELAFFRLRRWPGFFAGSAALLACVGVAFAGWALNLRLAAGINRTNVGSGGASLGMVEMLIQGVLALLRISPNATFDDRAGKMLLAFFSPYRRVWLLGSSATILLVIVLVSVGVWLLATTKKQRRQVLVFTLMMALGFCVYYLFMTINYTFVFSELEGVSLTGYERYIFPYWFAWLAGLLAQLALVATTTPPKQKAAEKIANAGKGPLGTLLGQSEWRRWAACTTSVVLCGAMLAVVALRTNWQSNFMHISPSQYTVRHDTQRVVDTALQEGLQSDDVVYLITQGDDATRFYQFAFELPARLVTLYAGDDRPSGTTAASFIAPGTQTGYREWVACTPQQWTAYLKERGCTHVLLDVTDGYIVQEFAPLFADGLAGWGDDGGYSGGQRYYTITWQGDTCVLIPTEGGGADG